MPDNYTLYGAPLSLYTGKTRAYLRFKQIPFDEVFSSLSVYKKVIIPKTGVRFIPVLRTPTDKFIQDTSVIMDSLEAEFPLRSAVPKGPKQRLVSAIFEMWADEWLLLPAMHYRWNHDNFPFIYEEFGKVVMPYMPAFVRRIMGKKAGAKFKGFVPMLGITPKSIPAIENWYENEVLPMLDAHFARHDYLLGSRPCIGDFGLIGPMYAHLYRDPASGKLMKRLAPNVVKWVERMNQDNVQLGRWCVNDRIPETLLPLLQQQFKEFWPVQLDTAKHVQEWIEQNPKASKLPRALGEHSFQIGNVTEKRVIRTFSQWKLQRVLDVYQAMSDDEKQRVDPLLKELGGYEVMQTVIERRVTRTNNVLVVADC
ncbi:glutathione S-transferase family protein [Glaciecola sp. SC05]|uniref:glutathione S-transferase family protein n=1 Tax=Glaciecola sp. SC05 TaxID=1987355 RepID=UPI0035277EE7